MLVLVLILVVIALVLLLAGWFLHLVVLAWASVGISLIAAAVLVYDWLQTRSAERAGRQGLASADQTPGRGSDEDRAGAAGTGYDDRRAAEMEPATQVLPIVPRATTPPSAGSAPSQDPAQVGDERPGAPESAADQTVVMPVIRPSGSADAPSGVSRSGGVSSQSVTESPTSTGDGAPEGARSSTSSEGSAAVAAGAAAPEVDHGTSRPGDGGTPPVPAGGSGEPPGSGTASDADAASGSGPGAGTAAGLAAGAAAVAGVAGSGRGGDPGDGDASTAGETDRGGSSTSASAAGASAPGAPETSAAATTTATDTAAAGSTSGENTSGAGPSAAGAPAVPTDGSAERTAMLDPQGADRSAGADDVPAAVGDAPEEPRDPTTASLVARLPDEVVVIDEHPRYHVQGCRSLPGQSVIPLPVSEAVELGFTPCGWCSPNRTLGERHPAQVR
ncbi:MAG: hypothetical protein L0I76_17960 [Pseudonocardia sp.]|nr:hypothetical protein [Pseudonocardia sp.]